MKIKKDLKYFVILIIIIIFFIFIRFYNIKNGLFFYNDLGRDALVLFNWLKTKKPPLLGPQTSLLPINQSPVYFYWLMIFYILLDSNPIYSVFAVVFFWILILIFGFYFFRKNKFFLTLWLGVFFLMTVHPQCIIQTRYVWNPSFTPILVLFSILSFYQNLIENKNLFLSTFFLAGSIGFSYSITPLFFIFLSYLFLFKRKKVFQFLFYFIISLLFFYLPVIIFEFRHDFLLIKSLFTKPKPIQNFLNFNSKFNSLSSFIIGSDNLFLNQLMLVFIFFYSLIAFLN